MIALWDGSNSLSCQPQSVLGKENTNNNYNHNNAYIYTYIQVLCNFTQQPGNVIDLQSFDLTEMHLDQAV